LLLLRGYGPLGPFSRRLLAADSRATRSTTRSPASGASDEYAARHRLAAMSFARPHVIRVTRAVEDRCGNYPHQLQYDGP